MRRTSVKLAWMGALAVVVAMIAASVAFNLFIGWKIESDATSTVEYVLEYGDEYLDSGRVPNYVLVDADYRVDAEQRKWTASEEFQLVEWFAAHPSQDGAVRVALDNWVCYAGKVPIGVFAAYGDDSPYGAGPYDREALGEPGYLIAYVDVTDEQALVASVNVVFAIIAILGALGAAAASFFAGRRIERAQEAQKRFYENMSHELKTPLASIGGYAEGMASGVVGAPEALVAITRETGKMAGLIDEMLGLSRLEAGAVVVNKELIELDDFVQDCLMPFEATVRSKGLDVMLDVVPGTVEADPALLDHAVTNIISNAVRHAARAIRVTYDGSALRVWNDGNVPTSEQLEHLFDRFYTGEGGSTGIGLAYAREIVSLHGWSIDARVYDGGLAISLQFSH